MQRRLFLLLNGVCHIQYQGIVLLALMLLVMPSVLIAKQTVLVMGDSLSAAYNLPADQGWVALTAKRMKTTNPNWQVVNASISGETTSGGLSRLPAALKQHKPSLVIIELGANDALRGLPLTLSRQNLLSMIRQSKAANAKVLLIGMQMPPNYGKIYTEGFANNYRDLAKQEKTAFLPFLLQPIALDRNYFLADQNHPNAAGQIKVQEHVWPVLKPLL
ncbi:MAG: arylesterase [Arenimonas sp.]|nr:arylesterase [Arenimonas sp.]